MTDIVTVLKDLALSNDFWLKCPVHVGFTKRITKPKSRNTNVAAKWANQTNLHFKNNIVAVPHQIITQDYTVKP